MKKTKPKKKVLLNEKQMAVMRGVAEGKTIQQAALDAGYSASTARNGLQDIINSPATREQLREEIRRLFPAAELIRHLRIGAQAEETKFTPKVTTKIQKPGPDGTLITRESYEAHRETRVPNWGERRRYLELLAKLAGYMEEKPMVAIDARTADAAGESSDTARLKKQVDLFSEVALKKAKAYEIELPDDLRVAEIEMVTAQDDEEQPAWGAKIQ